MKKRIIIVAAIVLLLISAASFAESRSESKSKYYEVQHDLGGVHLSPALKTLLIQEMRALQNGITILAPAIVTGNWSEVEGIGTKMKESYILEKEITAKQAAELKDSLPGFFKQLDHTLHLSAGMMAEAAKEKNSLLVSFYYNNMIDACIGCHTKYATKKFPSFLEGPTQSTHSHGETEKHH